MNNTFCVYIHTFPNKKRYIGITCCEPNRRWQNGYGYVNQKYMYNAILKYGWENIIHEIIADGLSLEEANRKEQELIAKYKTTNRAYGYNIEVGGKACGHLTQEHKDKIGKANKGEHNGRYGYRYTQEEREKLSLNSVWRGRKHTEESRKKMSEYAKAHPEIKSHKGESHPMYGKKHTDDAKRKMSDAAKNRGYCGKRQRMVCMYSKDGEYLKTFNSIADAARYLGINGGGQNIGAVCHGRRPLAYDYSWRFADGK